MDPPFTYIKPKAKRVIIQAGTVAMTMIVIITVPSMKLIRILDKH